MLRARLGRLAPALRRGLSSGHNSDVTGAEFEFIKPLDARHSDGWDILNNPLWNKGTAFSGSERDALGLRGLLPHHNWTIQEQVASFMGRLSEIDDKPLMQNLMLQDLQSRNETLFHRVLLRLAPFDPHARPCHMVKPSVEQAPLSQLTHIIGRVQRAAQCPHSALQLPLHPNHHLQPKK